MKFSLAGVAMSSDARSRVWWSRFAYKGGVLDGSWDGRGAPFHGRRGLVCVLRGMSVRLAVSRHISGFRRFSI